MGHPRESKARARSSLSNAAAARLEALARMVGKAHRRWAPARPRLALGAALALALDAHALARGTAVFVLFGAPLVAILILAAVTLVRTVAPPMPVGGIAATDGIG